MTISAANKLAIFNGALLFLGERSIVSLTADPDSESRRLLNGVWDRDGIKTVLEQGLWNFATRSAKLEYAPSITPAFGHERAFEKPSDLIRVSALCSDEFFYSPLLEYLDEGGFWFATIDEIYLRYISDDSSYGTDFSMWPPTFKEYVYSFFGSQIVWKLTQNKTKRDDAKELSKELRVQARSKDAMNEPTKFEPPGRFRMARNSYSGSNRDRGNRSQLLG